MPIIGTFSSTKRERSGQDSNSISIFPLLPRQNIYLQISKISNAVSIIK